MPRIPGVRRFLRLPRAERDVTAAVDDELAFHVDMLTDELTAAGHSAEEARREALRRFGDIDGVRQRCYDIDTERETHVRRTELFSTIWQDLRYAARSLRRAPGFSLVVLLTLALGIGTTTAMFSVVRGVLLRALPFPQAERVVRIWPAKPGDAADRGEVSADEFKDWERGLPGFSAVGAFRSFGTGSVYGDADEPMYVPVAYVSAGFFPALGTPAATGRTFTPGEHVEGTNTSAVVSYSFWERQLGADSHALGRTIRLDGKPYQVVGVMPRDFAYPAAGTAVWLSTSLLGPSSVGSGRAARWLEIVGRLKPGVTPEQGRAQVEALLKQLATTYPETNRGWTAAAMESVRDTIVGPVRKGLLVLLGAVGLVLLVVCANVANLVLVRGTARVRELALRAAIGAGRARIVRLLLTESLLLAIVGGLLGVLAAWWGVRTIVALSGEFLPRAADVRLDGGVLAFAIAVSLVTGVLFGLWPALRTSAGTRLAPSLHEDARGAVGSAASNRARAALVTAEVALAVVLVVGAGLMLRSFQRLTSVDPGFHPDGVLLVRLAVKFEDKLPPAEAFTRLVTTRERVVDRVRQVPGVVAAGATKFAPFAGEGGEAIPFTVPGQPAPAPGTEPRVSLQPVSPGYLKALGVPLVAGQDIGATARDGADTAGAVINRRMAERFWPGRSPVGESFLIGTSSVRIIGVAGDVRSMRLDSVPEFTAYLSDRSMPRSAMGLVVRTSGDPMRVAPAVRAAIREVLPGQAFQEVTPLRSKLSDAASTPRFFTVLVTVFGVLALTLAAVGLYGVVAYVVRQREREIGVRMALGAPPARVLTLMLRQGMEPVAVGLVVGLVGALVVTRVLRSLLFEVSATDPLTFVGVAALLGAVALLASYLPSRRATRVHPATILRAE